jgi:probable F420-dependent oxidoreductase
VAADELGYDAVLLSDHVVFPDRMAGVLPGGHPPPPPTTPVVDTLTYLGFLAGRTRRVRLGTFVYLLALRHPLMAARSFATLDNISGGRALAGVGAGWLTSEFEALQLDPRTRGSRLDEAIAVCRRLWSEPVVEHRGRHFSFEAVRFEPKPERPLSIHVGGDSDRALARAARLGDGWMGGYHTPETAARQARRVGQLLGEQGRPADALEITVAGQVNNGDDWATFAAAGVHRVVVTPWHTSRDAVDSLEALAGRVGLRRGEGG